MESIGRIIVSLASAIAAGAAAVWLVGLTWELFSTVRGEARRPMWLNYAPLVFGLSVTTMIVGLVIWGRLPWWMLILFAPFLAMRVIAFRFGTSVSRRNEVGDAER